MRGKNEKFRLSTHVRLLPLTLDSKLGLTNYLKITTNQIARMNSARIDM